MHTIMEHSAVVVVFVFVFAIRTPYRLEVLIRRGNRKLILIWSDRCACPLVRIWVAYKTTRPETTLFPRLERARSINFILVLRGGLFEGTLARSIELKPTTSSQFI